MAFSNLPPLPADFSRRSAWLQQVAALTKEQHAVSRSRELAWSWTRLFTFLCIPIGGYYYLAQSANWGSWLAVGGFALFCVAVLRHHTCLSRTLRLRLQRDIIAESEQRIAGGPVIIRTGMAPAATEVWQEICRRLDGDAPSQSLSPQEIDDLDLYGEPSSLFGILNRTSTPVGEARLAHALEHPLSSVEPIQSRQTAVRWLAEHAAERLQLMAAAAGLRVFRAACTRLYEVIRDATPLPGPRRAVALRLWSLAGPAGIFLGVAARYGWIEIPLPWMPLVVVLLINAVLVQTFLREVRVRIRPWLDLGDAVERLLFFTEVAAKSVPADGLLGEQHRRLRAALGRGCLPSLASRIPLLYFGLSGMMHALVDLLIFWDLHVLWLLERCYLRHRAPLIDVFAALAECELLSSLASFAAEEGDAVWPRFVPDRCGIEIENGRHPLIASKTAVCNSLSLDERCNTWIVTGSNMSGKSTFLRMAGVNVLLARIGSAVTAGRATLAPIDLLTDLRIRDDLSRQESYFLAEVRQVRRMVEATKAGRRFFALIDEPFRGTNSPERVAAASAVISALIDGSGLQLVATHDAALTILGEKPRAANRHFQESLDQGQMVFDYKLRPGPARSRNALNVLEAEGYPPQVVAEARRLLAEMGVPA
ncbi:MAG TPA: hypothetical protein VMV94_15450 [Phycisphaerae bacterium]|nr:hypothetical protein [Phycisphaerae bacterium]